MKRFTVIAGLCALLLSAAAWADGIKLTNKFGSVKVTNAGIVSKGMELKSYGLITAGVGQSLGSVSFSTGAFTAAGTCSVSPLCSGTFAGGAASSFIVTGGGAWIKTLTGTNSTHVTLFSGSFVGPINWQLLSIGPHGYTYNFELTGTIRGQFWDGRTVSGTTTQFITLYKNQWVTDNQGNVGLGSTQLAVPEPSTLGLLGTGLIGIAGTLRRKMFGV
jgi:PEP-CTERM motif